MEYELIDTGVFDENRYFDVFVEVAKAAPEDMLIRIRAVNHGPDPAELHILPQLLFRDTSWLEKDAPLPSSAAAGTQPKATGLSAPCIPPWASMSCTAKELPELLFTDNATNRQRLFNQPNPTPYVKDAFHEYVVGGKTPSRSTRR